MIYTWIGEAVINIENWMSIRAMGPETHERQVFMLVLRVRR